MKKFILGTVILMGFLVSALNAVSSVSCDNYNIVDKKCYYNKSFAVNYALNNLNINKWNNYFPSYKYYGGDCTNFANQAILAGFVGSSSPKNIRNKVNKYDIDKRTYAPYKWYFYSKNNLSHSWKGANDFFEYVNKNKNHSYNGLHLDFITKDSKTNTLNFNKIKSGDIMFADWDGDEYIDHTMIVTQRGSSYCGTRVTYQNDDTHTPKYNIRLCDINKLNTVFYNYRPVFYYEGGYGVTLKRGI